MPGTSDAIAKLARSREHLYDLEARIRTFVKSGAYQAVAHLDIDRGGIAVVGRVLAEPPVTEWGVLVGEIVHNARSALDNAVWALSCHYAGPPPRDPIPRGDPWRGVGFPIVLRVDDWGSAAGRDLWALPRPLRATAERWQPFRTGPVSPPREPLAILQELWNRDKHRHVQITQCYVGLSGVFSHHEAEFRAPKRRIIYGPGGFCADCPGPPEHEHPLHNIVEDAIRAELGRIPYRVIESRPIGPFEDGAELGLVAPDPGPGDWMVGAPELDVNPILTFDVAFDDQAMSGKPAMSVLTEVVEVATIVVGELESSLG